MSSLAACDNTFILFEERGLMLAGENVHFVRCSYNKSKYQNELFSQYGLVFPESLRTSVTKRQSEYLAGRYCASEALQKINIQEINVGTGSKREPLWPLGVKGSISHTDFSSICIVSVSPNIKGLGVDQEVVLSPNLINEISQQIVNDEEITLLQAVDLNYTVAFSIAFSGKESFFKAMFPLFGEYFDFNAVSISSLILREGKGEFVLVLNKDFNSDFYRGVKVKGYFNLQEEMVETYVLLT